ncbi:MAG TPA: response regulator [Planctomycetaceae bacterium]|nr:response regulator [Planctomycetaceae bacterium]
MSKILLIEDNETNRDLISRYLELFEYEVTVAADGREGLAKIQTNRDSIDLILMDMNLPEMDGWELTRRLKADETTRSLPVIALTAHAMKGDREKAFAAGCDDYATKPIDFKKLFRKIESMTRKAPC